MGHITTGESHLEPLLLKPQEVADILKIGRSKTYQLIAAGVIPSVRLGTSLRVPLGDLRACIETLVKERGQDAA